MVQYMANFRFQGLRIACYLILFALFAVGVGCRKFVQVAPPTTELVTASVYANNSSAASSLTAIYDNIYSNALSSFAGGDESITLFMGLASDELTMYVNSNSYSDESAFYSNALTSNSVQANVFWRQFYSYIYDANAAIAGLNSSTGVTTPVKQQLLGEAEFLRAFLHFYGVNLFGDIPLVTTTNYQVNTSLRRTSVAQVYHQIIADLKDAQGKLSSIYLGNNVQSTSSDRVRPTKWAAAALLSRSYLNTGDWASAEKEADTVINAVQLFHFCGLDSVFLKNSSEAIWQLEPVGTGFNSYDGWFFLLSGAPTSGGLQNVSISPWLLQSFETGDRRFNHWVDSVVVNGTAYYYPYKYKLTSSNASNFVVNEYQMVFRLAEQYLIRAEARAQQGNLTGAIADLNTIRARAGLAGTMASSQSDILNAIYHERQVELFTEWGDRWFTLNRSGSINTVMGTLTSQKSNGQQQWSPDWALLPIPQQEIILNSNLTQNPGY